jgi:hypothetical protein
MRRVAVSETTDAGRLPGNSLFASETSQSVLAVDQFDLSPFELVVAMIKHLPSVGQFI